MILKNCDMKAFSERCRGKKLACFGIGFDFEKILKNYRGYAWMRQIAYLLDNSPSKAGTKKEIAGRVYEVESLERFLATNPACSGLVILITCSHWAEIVEQLNALEAFGGTECYIYDFMYALSEGEVLEIPRAESCRIPSVIHYCWFGKKELPDLYKRCIESWRTFCPGYEIKEWNEANCDTDETVFTKQAYECGRYGFVPDYFRLKIIYEHGGIYLDTDVELLKSLDDLRKNEAFCGLEAPGEAALGLGFGAVPGHGVIKRLMERYRRMRFIKPDGTQDETISPLYQTEDLMELGMEYGNRLQTVEGMTIYPTEVLSPKNIITGELCITEYSYALHHYDGSWVSGERLRKKRRREEAVKKIRRFI
ncbi:MAG: hypothetical protein HFE83_10330 [Lachnospiraceae bacterium]|nr:hypothetical protein [Lachnospiraceae bacterium]